MLIQFNFKNFKSYKDEVSLDMTASSINEHEYNLIEGKKGENYLKVCSIHGANASGKSNVIEAFNFMRNFVINSFSDENKGKDIELKQFAFCNEKKDSEFEVFFIYKDKEYQYGFNLDMNGINEEWLYKRDYRGKAKYTTLFERKGKIINIGRTFIDADKFKNFVEKKTLFLSFLSNVKIEEAKLITEWFRESIAIDFGNALMETIMTMTMPFNEIETEEYRERFVEFLKGIDIGIEDLEVEKIKSDTKSKYKFYSYHKAKNCDNFVRLPFTEESSGTQKIAALYHVIMQAIKNGSTIFIDELDAKLHPLMLRYIINLFHNADINKSGAQLIFTSQEVTILNNDLFRRDQILLVDKNEYGESQLTSLVEYVLDNDKKVRKDASFAKDYLTGKYGAIPIFKNLNLKV